MTDGPTPEGVSRRRFIGYLIAAPTLVTVGRTDWVTPVASSETIASLMPHAELVVFERSGHSPQMEEPELFQATLRRFLAGVFPQLDGLAPSEDPAELAPER